MDIDEEANTTDLFYEPAWLAVLKSTDKFTNTSDQVRNSFYGSLFLQKTYLPSAQSNERWDFRPTAEELAEIEKLGDLKIPTDFKRTAVPCNGEPARERAVPSPYYR